VEITLEGDTLTIKGEIKPPLENVDYIFQERAYGPFSRTLTLNVPVDAEKAEATFENGILTLTIPKAESVKPKTIKVKSK
jgi:HSP20 family protein